MTTIALLGKALEDVLGTGVVATHRHNHAGADKLAFEVLARGRRLWVKIAASDDEDADLRAWASVAGDLVDRHAAPPVLDVIQVEGRTGLLFPYLDAEVATRTSVRDRYAEVQAVLDGLHADGDLADRLGGPTTSRAIFREVWISRFEADLIIIAGHVARDVHEYLTVDVQHLSDVVDSLDEQVHSVVHGDPWHENVMFEPGRMWLLDWEDLCVGDAVIDDAILLMDAHGPRAAHWPTGRRFDIARRALMLDAVVDIAADWVQNSDAAIRGAKKRAYLDGLAAYRDEFGPS